MFEKIRNKMFKRNMESYEINIDELKNDLLYHFYKDQEGKKIIVNFKYTKGRTK